MKTAKILIAAILLACVVSLVFQSAYASNWDRYNVKEKRFSLLKQSGGEAQTSYHPDYIKRIATQVQKVCGLSLCSG